MVLLQCDHARFQHAHKIMIHIIENEIECTLGGKFKKFIEQNFRQKSYPNAYLEPFVFIDI